MSTNKVTRFSFFRWVAARWSPLTLVLILSALLAGAIVIGTLIQHHANSSTLSRRHISAQTSSSSSTSSSAMASGKASAGSTQTSNAGSASKAAAPAVHSSSGSQSAASAQNTSSDHSAVIKTASLTLQSPHPTSSASKLRELTAANGGYIQNMQTRQQQKKATVVMTVRVPSNRFSSFLDKMKSFGTTKSFSQSGHDVTQQSNNLQVRLNQLQSESSAYARLYQKAKTMKDMLQIQQSLTHVNSEISTVKQQIQHLNQSVQFGTITIDLVPKAAVTVTHQKSALSPLIQSLHFMRQSFLALVTFLAWVLPWGVLVGLGMWLWTRWKRWQSSTKKSS